MGSYLALGVVVVIAGFVSYVTYLEIKIKSLEGKLAQSKEREEDDGIAEKVRSMSDAELDSSLAKHIGSGDPKA